MKYLERWVGIALINLAIVASLGLLLRSKMLFSIPFIDFKYLLHAHSHFAFGGWVTLALLSLMTYQILPSQYNRKSVYKWLLAGVLVNAFGMLFSFPFEGYAFFSILFSTLFIFSTYGFAFVFIKDIIQSPAGKSVKILSVSAMVYMAISSVGAFTLAYLLATKSNNVYLSKDAIYTYLHLQYNGFFTLAVFALMLHYIKAENKHTVRFAHLLNLSVIPSMFISYLWHYPDIITRIVAFAGCLLLMVCVISFLIMMRASMHLFKNLKRISKQIAALAMISFALKMIFQSLTIIPFLGPLIFTNRPVIIGFLHLVLLGFISLYLLAHFIQTDLLRDTKMATCALCIFIIGIVINEVVLFAQGLGIMLMMGNSFVNWLLWSAAICLFSGASLIAFSRLKFSNSFLPENSQTESHKIILSIIKNN